MVYLAIFGSAIATALGWAVLGEAQRPAQLTGMAVALLGVALVALPSRLA